MKEIRSEEANNMKSIAESKRALINRSSVHKHKRQKRWHMCMNVVTRLGNILHRSLFNVS